jgi:two-component system sensor histidine kinase/response regulator
MAQYLGVRYIYAEDVSQEFKTHSIYSSQEKVDWQQQMMTVMSPEWINQFHQATLIGRDQEMLELIQEIPADHQALAQVLTDLTHNFEFDKILEITAILETDQA